MGEKYSHDVRLAVLEEQGRWMAAQMHKAHEKLDIVIEELAASKAKDKTITGIMSATIAVVVSIVTAFIARANGR